MIANSRDRLGAILDEAKTLTRQEITVALRAPALNIIGLLNARANDLAANKSAVAIEFNRVQAMVTVQKRAEENTNWGLF